MWPLSRAVSNRALQAVPTSCVPNVWQEGGGNSVPALICLAARHFSLSNQTVRLEWDPYSCLFPSPPEASSPSREKTQVHACVHIFPPERHQTSSVHRYTHLETRTTEWIVQSVPSLFLSAAAFFPSFLFFSQTKWASLSFLSIFQSYRKQSVSRYPFLRDVWREKMLSVCVWLYWTWWGMILWWMLLPPPDEGRIPFVSRSLTVMSICHSPQHRTLVFIKINILSTHLSISPLPVFIATCIFANKVKNDCLKFL